jgi:diguanylate cyclase (GGDEF)-like protein
VKAVWRGPLPVANPVRKFNLTLRNAFTRGAHDRPVMSNGTHGSAAQRRRVIIARTARMTALSVVLSVAICIACMLAFFPTDSAAAMTIEQQWLVAIVMSAAIPGLVAPVVIWRIQTLMDALDEANAALARLAATDQLTGLLNRRGFEEAAEALLKEASRSGAPVAALMCDIDHFKKINDTYGHDFGDQAIRHVARLIAGKQAAAGAIAGRHGGEEFVLLLPGASQGQARLIAEELRIACSLSPVEWNGQSARVTISAGLVVVERVESNLGQMLNQADLALYAAKRGGRNQVVLGPVEEGAAQAA